MRFKLALSAVILIDFFVWLPAESVVVDSVPLQLANEFSIRSVKHGLELQDQGNLIGAEVEWKNLLLGKSNLKEYVHYYYALNLIHQERKADAKFQLQSVLKLSPNIKLQQESQVQLAGLLLQEGSFQQARRLLLPIERKQRHEDSYAETIYLLGKAEMGVGSLGAACRWWRKLFVKYPSFAKISDWGPHLAENKVDNRMVACQADVEDHRLRIKNLQWAGRDDKAAQELAVVKAETKIYDQKDRDRLQSSFWIQEGEVNKALDLLLLGYEERKNDTGYLSSLALAAARSGELQLAVGSHYRIFQIAPRSKKGKEALYQSAFLSYQFQDYDGASRRFKDFIRSFSNSGLARDAEWHLAWIRYLKGDYQGALSAFEKLLRTKYQGRRGQQKSVSKDRVHYWMAMAYLRQEKFESAKAIFEVLAKDRLLGYYAIASQIRLNKLEIQIPKASKVARESFRPQFRFDSEETLRPDDGFDSDQDTVDRDNETEDVLLGAIANPDDESSADDEPATDEVASEENIGIENVEDNPIGTSTNSKIVERFERARELMTVGLNDWAKWDLFDIERKTRNRDYLRTLMQEYESTGNFNRSSFLAQTFFGRQRAQLGLNGVRYLWEHAYPRAYQLQVSNYAKLFEIPSELIWGIMKQESQFRKDVVSPVGALGLMQIMPQTGYKVSELGKEQGFNAQSLLEPEGAIRVGSRYLQRLMKKFSGNIPLVAAGYNAGPHRVKNWLNSFGNLDLDEFIEHIPFLETRNYVKHVVSNVQIYSRLYSHLSAPESAAKKTDLLGYFCEPLTLRFENVNTAKETWEEL